MKAPRIVQSYWSKAYQNTPNSGWAFRESHYMSWALSCLQLKQFYDEIELVTDSEGADLLINKLHLPYTSCLTILDKLKNENPAIWALGKIAAYEVQQICSDFHLGRHFFGLVGGFFVGLSVIS